MPTTKPHAWIFAGLSVLTLAALGQVLGADFIRSDDPAYVTANPHVYTGLSWDNLTWAVTDVSLGMWQPLTFLSLQLDATLYWPQDSAVDPAIQAAWGFHLTNLLLQLANVLLLYWWLFRMTGRIGPSAMVAAVFAVHPLHVESVAWVTERKDVLSTFFLLLTLLAYVRYCEHPGKMRMLAALACFFLGLCAKPMIVTLPCLLLLLDYWPLGRLGGRRQASAPTTAKVLLEKVPFFLLAFMFMGLTILGHESAGGIYWEGSVPLTLRLANAVQSLVLYVFDTFCPWSLAAFYIMRFRTWTSPQVLASVAALVALAVFLVLAARRRPEQITGWLWFVVALLPVLGIIQAGDQSRADRFVYVPHIGLFIALVWGAADLLEWLKVPARVRPMLAAGVLASLAILTWFQAGYWKDEPTLWQHTLDVTGPDNYRAHGHLAIHCFLTGDYARAEEHVARTYSHAVKVPEFVRVDGYLLIRKQRWGEAIPKLEYALTGSPREGDIHEVLAQAYFHLGYYEKAASFARQALMWKQETAANRHLLGVALLRMGKHADGMANLEKSLALKPDFAQAHLDLGLAYQVQGKLTEALEHVTHALALEPGNEEARKTLEELRAKVKGGSSLSSAQVSSAC